MAGAPAGTSMTTRPSGLRSTMMSKYACAWGAEPAPSLRSDVCTSQPCNHPAHKKIQAACRRQHQQAHRHTGSPAAGCRRQCCWLPHLLPRAGQAAGWPPAAPPPPVAGACCSPPAAAAAPPRLRQCRRCRQQRRRRWLAGTPLRNAGCFLSFSCGFVAVPGSAGSREALQRESSSPSWLRAVFCVG